MHISDITFTRRISKSFEIGHALAHGSMGLLVINVTSESCPSAPTGLPSGLGCQVTVDACESCCMLCGSIPGRSETSSSTGSLGPHIVTILEHPAALALLAGKIR